MNTFKVSDVKLNKFTKVNENNLIESIKLLTKTSPEASAANQEVNVVANMNAFVQTVYTSYQDHLPLIISPDDIWLCISQGFANHVNANEKTLRKQFVQHKGKEIIRIIRNDFIKGSPGNFWQGAFPEFSDKIAEYIEKKRDLVIADFSTTGIIEKAASEIVLMDAMQKFFNYRCMTMCGIPEITLSGTKDDWKNIKTRVSAFAEFDLKWWVDALFPILDKIIESSSNTTDYTGNIDKDFWKSFFKEDNGSGGPYISGWINTLFPYLEDYSTKLYTRKNDCVENWSKNMNKYFHSGPSTDQFPIGLSKVPFIWEYYEKEFPMQFFGGFVGVNKNINNFTVRPVIGWAVSDRKENE